MRILLAIIFVLVLTYTLVFSTAVSSYTVLNPPNRSLGEDTVDNPCVILGDAQEELWWNPEYADTDRYYDVLIVDWEAKELWRVYQHADRDFAYIWGDHSPGLDGNPHPNQIVFVDCQFN